MPDCEAHRGALLGWAFQDRFDPGTAQPEDGYVGQYAVALRRGVQLPKLPEMYRRHAEILQDCASAILAGECVFFDEPLFTANPSTGELYAFIREKPGDSSTLDS